MISRAKKEDGFVEFVRIKLEAGAGPAHSPQTKLYI